MAASKKISVKKGLIQLVTVGLAYAVSAGAAAIAQASGIALTEDQQNQAVIAGVAGLTGLITAGLNWLKHRPKKVKPAEAVAVIQAVETELKK